MKKLGTDIHDITDKIPSNLPKPKLDRVTVDETPEIDKMDASLTVGEWLGRVLRAIPDTVSTGLKAVSDIAQIVAFVQAWWLPICAVGGAILLVLLFRACPI